MTRVSRLANKPCEGLSEWSEGEREALIREKSDKENKETC